MTNKPMIALGFAAALMLGTAAQAQTGMQRNENSAKPAPTGQMQKNANTFRHRSPFLLKHWSMPVDNSTP